MDGDVFVTFVTDVVVVVFRQDGGAVASLTNSLGRSGRHPRLLAFPLAGLSWFGHYVTFLLWWWGGCVFGPRNANSYGHS